ncbi:hypothetical protein GCM10027597_36530 [Saccharopolyspora tripterygii]
MRNRLRRLPDELVAGWRLAPWNAENPEVNHLGVPSLENPQPRATLPAFMQEVHTFMRLRWDRPILACTV